MLFKSKSSIQRRPLRSSPANCQLSNFLLIIGVIRTFFREWRILSSPATPETYNSSSTAADTQTNLSVMSSQAQPDVNERIQETAFNDAAIVTNDESTAPDTGIKRFHELSSIIAFLERPTLLWQSRIDSTSPSLQPVTSMSGRIITQTPLKTFTFPSDLMKLGNKFEKIANFEWFKTDIRLRILINANPFIAGRLWITYSPISDGDQLLEPYAEIEHKGRVGITSYPGVELDLQTNTAAELLVPWIHEFDAEQAAITSQSLFRVDIWMLTPLLVADNSLKIPIQVYGAFENIQLKFPTPIYRQATLQMKKEARGPITEMSSKISGAAAVLKDVPVVGSVASTVGWASGLVNGVASIFGWSRPIEGSNAQPFSPIPARGMTHFKAADSSVVLGMANDNEIGETEQNFISPVDEMSIAHVCSRPGLVDVITWNVSDDYNTSLGQYSANRATQSPNLKDVSFNEGDVKYTATAVDPTLGEMVLQNFHMYRADFTYRISLVKTAFHVGRFEVFFVPNQYDTLDVSKLDTSNCYRQIFDITEQSEMTFEIPYFHKCVMFQPRTGENTTIGSLIIRVVSPLTCPDTVSQSIKILVWKSISNVVVAHPHPKSDLPLSTQMFDTSYKPATMQINVTNEPRNTMYRVFDDENSMNDCVGAAKIVGGEMCVNLREATRAFRAYRGTLVTVDKQGVLLPNVVNYNSGGYLALCSYMYYFFRGGFSYKILTNTGKGMVSWLSLRLNGGNVEPFGDAPFHITPPQNPIHEISVPFYSEARRRYCSRNPAATNVDPFLPNVVLKYPDFTTPEVGDIALFIAAKDDLTFGFLIGPPIIARNKTLAPQ